MKRIVQSSWMVSLTGCIVYLATTAVVLSSAKFEGVGEEVIQFSVGDDPSWKFRNPEIDQWVLELKAEKAALEERKLQLNEWETRLKAERQELSGVTQMVAQLQADFDKSLIRVREQEFKNVKRQAKTLAEMSPDAAASLLDQLPDEDAVRVLASMKDEQVSLLIETLSKMGKAQSKHAAVITERMRHYMPDGTSATPNSPK
jgi:flagellar motility protein MotE (MotC chaperone)